MKRFFYLSLAAAAMLAVGCNKENEGEGPQGFGKGDGYVAFNIGLPTAPAVKANDDFDDGVADEYRVEDIVLVLFSGSDEASAQLASAYNLSDQRTVFELNNGNTQYDQITSSGTVVAEIKKSTLTGQNVYAFVILNDHQFVEVDPANYDLLASPKLFKQSETESHTGTAETKRSLRGTAFSEFKKFALDESGRNFSNSSFFMSNAPVATKAANAEWNGQLTTLVKFDADKIKSSYAAAQNDPAATINVERALAKVTVEYTETGYLQAAADQAPTSGVAYKILGWDLDNYNSMGFITRNFDDQTSGTGYKAEVDFSPVMKYRSANYSTGNFAYRFTSPAPIATANNFVNNKYDTEVYRTYWGQDVNYRNVGSTENITDGAPLNSRAGQSLVLEELRGNEATYYTPENTFDVAHQTVRNTTRLVLAAQIFGGKPFFTLQENASTLYPANDTDTTGTGLESIKTFLTHAVANRVNVRNWAKNYVDTSNGEHWADGLFSITFVPELTDEQAGVAFEAIPGMQYALVQVDPNAPLSLFNGDNEAQKTAARTNAIATFKQMPEGSEQTLDVLTVHYLANSYKLHYYPGGIAYYQALIKHFGDAETPWTAGEGMENTVASIYGTTNAEQNYLGRYGILRNNWYQLTVTGIRNIGTSVVPPLTDDPDDTVLNYISVKINILPWAIRKQTGIVL